MIEWLTVHRVYTGKPLGGKREAGGGGDVRLIEYCSALCCVCKYQVNLDEVYLVKGQP